MATQRITVEIEDETIRSLATLGEPSAVLARLADAAAEGVRRHRGIRDHTNESLQVERDKTDETIRKRDGAIDDAADEVVRIARSRADQIVFSARVDADAERRPKATPATDETERTRADSQLQEERSNADAELKQERTQLRRHRDAVFSREREATDKGLSGERTEADTVLVDQREANAQLLAAAIRANELTDSAEDAKTRAEAGERELRAVAEFREMFIGILGHDLRNPLTSISMAAAQLLRRGELDEQDERIAARIIRGSQRMTRMITQLLDLTRARLGGGLLLEPEHTDLRNVCRNVVEEFDATVELKLEGDLTGTWDADRLDEVLSNLIGNAIQYATPATLVVVRGRGDEGDVFVEVSNQGAAIPADVLPFIFAPFRRAKQVEKSATGNLGLGLYIAHQIVLSHGGTLEVRCADGTTTFMIRLPRSLAEGGPPSGPG